MSEVTFCKCIFVVKNFKEKHFCESVCFAFFYFNFLENYSFCALSGRCDFLKVNLYLPTFDLSSNVQYDVQNVS